MSDLLNSASLVMVPSGYKEDTVYSVVPSDGSGDLSFTRASNGTRVNSAGLVEVCPWNELTYSQEIQNTSVWNQLGGDLVVTGNAVISPDGTQNAGAITLANSANRYFVHTILGLTGGVPYTYSVYMKSASGNLSVNMGGVNGLAGVLKTVTTEWQRFTYTFTPSTSYGEYFGFDNRGAGSSTSGTLYFWGAQLNIGSTAKPYFPTTDRLNVPRLTYQNGGGGCPSLLLEKQSTNELSYSEQLDNAAWTVKDNLSVTANATTSPDGTQNADKLVEDSSNNQHRVYRSIDGTNKSFSFFAKAGERTWVAALSNNGNFTYFDIANGVLGTVAATSSASITAFGNGWYRCVLYNAHATNGALIQLALANNGTSYQGDGTSGAFIWGCQMEASSYPTSYISTTSSSATRVADDSFKTGISSLIGQTEGVLFADVVIPSYDNVAKWIAFLGAKNSTTFLGIYVNSSNGITAEVLNSTQQALIIYNSFSVGTRYKIALAYKQNDFAFYINGTQIGTDTSGTVPTVSEFNFNYQLIDSLMGVRNYNQVALFPTRLTNAELASLTTI